MISKLNYHHLRYFHQVASEDHLGRAAERLNVSQSALSIQIKQLEERLGHALFERVSRKLVLTEAGRIALDHAERIFGAGEELLATLGQTSTRTSPLRVGAMSTLSRNFQLQFLRPLLGSDTHGFTLKSGNMPTLVADLEALSLDVILTTQVPESGPDLAAQKIAEQDVGIHAVPHRLKHKTIEDLLSKEPVILPTESVIRTGFKNLVARLGVDVNVVADVDDMAMVRLLAREGIGLAIAPSVVVADELATGVLKTAKFKLNVTEPFFAVTIRRKFPHPALAHLMEAHSVG